MEQDKDTIVKLEMSDTKSEKITLALKTNDEDLSGLHAKIKEVYSCCNCEQMDSISTTEMLSSIEDSLHKLFDFIESVPKGRLQRLKQAVTAEKRRIIVAETQRMDEERRLEKMKKHLERSMCKTVHVPKKKVMTRYYLKPAGRKTKVKSKQSAEANNIDQEPERLQLIYKTDKQKFEVTKSFLEPMERVFQADSDADDKTSMVDLEVVLNSTDLLSRNMRTFVLEDEIDPASGQKTEADKKTYQLPVSSTCKLKLPTQFNPLLKLNCSDIQRMKRYMTKRWIPLISNMYDYLPPPVAYPHQRQTQHN